MPLLVQFRDHSASAPVIMESLQPHPHDFYSWRQSRPAVDNGPRAATNAARASDDHVSSAK